MDKLKACLTKALAHDEPSDEEVAEAVIEALDIVGSIANSLERIAVSAERQVQPMHGISERSSDDRSFMGRKYGPAD